MNAVRLIFALLCCAPSAILAQSNNVFSISYAHAGLTGVQIKDGQLAYTWHTERKWGNGEPAPMRQDLSSYDRHEATIWLRPEELNGFRQWGETNHISRFHAPFPARAGAPSYASAFQTTLTVVSGGSRQDLAWNGDNKVPPELTAAVQELVRLCHDIEGRRRK